MEGKKVLEEASKNGVALTYDDVRLKSGYSAVMPDLVSLDSRFSKNVSLKIPIVSAAMDTVTEGKMAIELAKLGGLGIIHKNLSIEEQAAQVAKVKFHLNGLVEKPICFHEDDSIEFILRNIREKGFGFTSFPIVNSDEELVGILTGNDFEFCEDKKLFAKDLMSNELLIAPKDTSLDEAYKIMIKNKKKVLPLVEDKKIVGLYVFSDLKRIKTGSAKNYNVDSNNQLRVGAAIGTGEEAIERTKELFRKNIDVVVIDTAHGDSLPVYETLKKIKKLFPDLDVVVGNVSVGKSARRLAEAGADGIKVGQGPGSICTTRIIAGIGRPQVSAVYDCAKQVQEFNIPVCADGGIKNSGDISVAIGAGASSVMMGSLLSGTDESPGKVIFKDGRQWKSYRGMGSMGAMEENSGSRERYNQKESGKDKLIPEGIEGLTPYKGKLKDVIFQYVGGLRRGMGYVGAKSIEELKEKGDFDRITGAGLSESHPHDVLITKAAPNYNR
ncbi:MAG: IMP dehydrogenase [Candidatus Pacearchaeota archaeon]|jgi:IMP dehydrogenase